MNTELENKDLTSNDAKPMLNDGFVIDFFELMFLAESVIPERPITRSMCFDDFFERHYRQMNENQRLQFLNTFRNVTRFTLEERNNADTSLQFNLKSILSFLFFTTVKAETIQCYMFDEDYRTSKNRFVNQDYIKSVVRIHDSQNYHLTLNGYISKPKFSADKLKLIFKI